MMWHALPIYEDDVTSPPDRKKNIQQQKKKRNPKIGRLPKYTKILWFLEIKQKKT